MERDKKELQLYIEEHLNRRRFADKTKEAYTYWMNRLTDFFGKYSLLDFTLNDLSEFIKHLEETENLAPNTTRQATASFHLFFNTLLKQNWEIKQLRKKRIKRMPQNVHIPTQEEIFSIIDTITTKQSRLAIALVY